MRNLTLGLALSVLALGACTAERKVRLPGSAHAAGSPVPASSVASGILDERAVTVTATVQAIDPQTRRLTLRRSDGTQFTIVVAPDESNLLALALASDVDDLTRFDAGDEVTLTYRESTAFQVKRPDQAKPGVAHTTDVTHAPRGEKPAVSATATTDLRASVTAVDEAEATVTIRDAGGHAATIAIPDARTLRAIAVGDVMDIAFNAALAITVRKPAAQRR